MNWWRGLRGTVKLAQPLYRHTTFKIGGPAKFFIEPRDINDLELLLSLLKRYKIPYFVIGAGSNILASDRGVGGVVLHLGSPGFKKIVFHKDNTLEAGSGCPLSRIIGAAKEHGLGGMEFLSGVPGSLGGALAMNAGQSCNGASIAGLVEDITVMDSLGRVKNLKKEDIKFGYRKSNLSKYIILGARLRLIKKRKKEIDKEIKEYLGYRWLKQDISHPSAGSVFKNPRGDAAGRLIDACGLKGRKIGGALISPKHANFILNIKHASSSDVLKLISLIRKRVYDRFKINLETEIKIWK